MQDLILIEIVITSNIVGRVVHLHHLMSLHLLYLSILQTETTGMGTNTKKSILEVTK